MRDLAVIYIARGLTSGLLKIGRTRNVPTRLRTLATSHESVELLATIPAAPSLELDLHRRFASALARGKEWFHDDGRILALVASLPEAQRGSLTFTRSRTPAPRRPREVVVAERRAEFRESMAKRDTVAASHGHSVDKPCAACRARWQRYLKRMADGAAARDATQAADPFLYPLYREPAARAA